MCTLIGGCDGEIRSVISAPSLSCFFLQVVWFRLVLQKQVLLYSNRSGNMVCRYDPYIVMMSVIRVL
jgi:hypothetical protein